MNAKITDIMAELDGIERAFDRLNKMVKTSDEFRALLTADSAAEVELHLALLTGIYRDMPRLLRHIVAKTSTMPVDRDVNTRGRMSFLKRFSIEKK